MRARQMRGMEKNKGGRPTGLMQAQVEQMQAIIENMAGALPQALTKTHPL